jgi:hypothetical protein
MTRAALARTYWNYIREAAALADEGDPVGADIYRAAALALIRNADRLCRVHGPATDGTSDPT